MVILFWIIFCFLFYCYVGYPIALFFVSKTKAKKVDKADCFPFVSVVISVWNEDDVLDMKIHNLFALDYPKGKIEILIGSDGSNDRTNEILAMYQDQIRFFLYPQRRGKISVLNGLLKEAKGEIIVFNDARQKLDSKSIQELVANFHDKEVGCVSGELILSHKECGIAKGVNLYWRYEKFLRLKESAIHSMLGATGAIYAIRKNLYHPIPCEIVLDDVFIPFKIISKGLRAIFDPSAKSYDEVSGSPREEDRRKVRTLYGNCQIFKAFAGLFYPMKSPIAIQFFSHKFLRMAAPFLMIAFFLVNFSLCSSFLYFIVFMTQILFYFMALIGYMTQYDSHGFYKAVSNVCYVPFVFCLLNFSALRGFFQFLFSYQDARWKKAREGDDAKRKALD